VEGSHLTLETLARLLSGRLEHEELLEQVLPHLLALCPVCREKREELRRLQDEVGHWDEAVAAFEWPEAPQLFADLASHPYEDQLRLAEEDDSLHVWGFAQLLLKRTLETVFSDPHGAVQLAHLGLKISLHLGAHYDSNWVLDLQARAFAYLGNALRVLGELRSADEAFLESARRWALSTTGNVLVQAEILHLKSSLRRAQRRLGESLELVDQALALYRQLADSSGIAACLLSKSKVLEETGDFEGAAGLLRAGIPEIDAAGSLKISAYARLNLLVSLTLANRFEEAEKLIPEARARFQESAQPLDLVRLHWTEGLVDSGLGRREAAEGAFREVQKEFAARQMGYDAALVSLDLAIILAEEGRTEDLKRLAAELVPIFAARDVHREALIALFMFQQACEQERLTVELARHLADFLRKERIPQPSGA
jgi:tetratricopeptide (TPR) repeat protein